MKVLKFGGSSVGSPEIIKKVVEIAEGEKKSCVIVVSAFKGITDQIISTSEMANRQNLSYKKEIKLIRERHLSAVNELIPEEKKKTALEVVNKMIDEMADLMYGIYLIRDLTPKTMDHILSFGERLSSFIITNAFKNAQCIDMRKFIKTNSEFGKARVDFDSTNKNIREAISKKSGIYVAPGFIASNKKNDITTIGRGGSDYTAAIIASAIDAEILEIWTDVDGFMTADPKRVSKAHVIKKMSYSEALELSHFGAKVVYTPTLHPAYHKNIPIRILNTFNPTAPGTLISKNPGNHSISPIKGISSIDMISLVTLQGSGLPGVTGISMRLFTALASKNINIVLITQASSEYSISFAISPEDDKIAREAIVKEFQIEIQINKTIDLTIVNKLSVIAIVGEKMKHTPGISANLFSSLGKNGISVIATAQGSSELNISVVIEQKLLNKALNVIHEGFFLSNYKELHLYIAGTGNVAKSLLQQITAHRQNLLKEHNLKINIIGLINSRKMLFNPDGIESENYDELIDNSEKSRLHDFVKQIKSLNLRNSVFIDCTASEDVSNTYEQLFDQYVAVVTANKIACSSSYKSYLSLKEKAKKKGVKFVFETNVGAGLPIINTINNLIRSGDKILGLEAVLSGTLNFIFNTISAEIPLSKAIKMAMDKGFSEPDPRIDLSGIDVLRKLLILSRESGYKLEEKDIKVKKFLPEACFEGDIEQFWMEVQKLDTSFEKERKILEEKQKRWRFVARLENQDFSIELLEVDSKHPAYELADSNNIVLITTERYKEQPMVIRGYGAGAEVTAAGVFADIIGIANL
jgi:bifunctional aspartokinase / homoserine dehydrogenase 1